MSAFDVSGQSNDFTPIDPLVNVLRTLEISARSSGRSSMPIIVAAVLTLPLGAMMGPYAPFVWICGAVVLYPLLLTTIHELGHLAAAWVADFHISLFVVGPLAIIRNGRSFRLAHSRTKGIAGGVVAVPNNPDNQTGWLVAYVASGAVANLMSGTVVLVAYLVFPTTPLSQLFVPVFVAFSFVTALIALVPLQVGAFATDGRIIIDLLRAEPQGERMRAYWRLFALERQKQRPRDWDTATLTTALSAADGSVFDASAWFMSYLHHLDAGREDIAASFIERAVASLNRVPLLFSAEYFAEAAYFFVQHGSDPVLARDILRRIERANVDDITRFRAEAAVLLAEGNTMHASQTAQRAITLAEERSDSGIALAERDLALCLLTRANSTEPLPQISQSRSVLDSHVAITPIA